MKKSLVLFLAFLLAGSVLYANSLDNGFHYDDESVIVKNKGLQDSGNLLSLFTSTINSSELPSGRRHYRPLVLTSYLLNYQVGGLNPIGYHLINLLIHIFAAFLTALVMSRMTGRFAVGALTGLIFLVHPFNAEAVNYITARSSQMYALFYLTAFYAYIRYRDSSNAPAHHPSPPSWRGGAGRGVSSSVWLGVCFLSFVLSMLSKEMAITLPVMLLFYEWLNGPTGSRRTVPRGLWISGALAAGVIIGYLVIRKILIGEVLPWIGEQDLAGQLASESVVAIRTLGLILWPFPLTVDHPVTLYNTFTSWPVIGACLGLIGIGGIIFGWSRSKDRGVRLRAFMLIWFFVALSPLAVIPLNAMLQENRAYLAMVGIVGLLAMGLVRILERVETKMPAVRGGIWAGIAILILIYAGFTTQRNAVWQDDLSLWSDAVQKSPSSVVARDNLGVAYRRLERYNLAAEQFRIALQLEPRRFVAAYNLGLIAFKQGQDPEAERWYRRTLQLEPGFYKAHLALGVLYERQERREDAVHEFRIAEKMNPEIREEILDGFPFMESIDHEMDR